MYFPTEGDLGFWYKAAPFDALLRHDFISAILRRKVYPGIEPGLIEGSPTFNRDYHCTNRPRE